MRRAPLIGLIGGHFEASQRRVIHIEGTQKLVIAEEMILLAV